MIIRPMKLILLMVLQPTEKWNKNVNLKNPEYFFSGKNQFFLSFDKQKKVLSKSITEN